MPHILFPYMFSYMYHVFKKRDSKRNIILASPFQPLNNDGVFFMILACLSLYTYSGWPFNIPLFAISHRSHTELSLSKRFLTLLSLVVDFAWRFLAILIALLWPSAAIGQHTHLIAGIITLEELNCGFRHVNSNSEHTLHSERRESTQNCHL